MINSIQTVEVAPKSSMVVAFSVLKTCFTLEERKEALITEKSLRRKENSADSAQSKLLSPRRVKMMMRYNAASGSTITKTNFVKRLNRKLKVDSSKIQN